MKVTEGAALIAGAYITDGGGFCLARRHAQTFLFLLRCLKGFIPEMEKESLPFKIHRTVLKRSIQKPPRQITRQYDIEQSGFYALIPLFEALMRQQT